MVGAHPVNVYEIPSADGLVGVVPLYDGKSPLAYVSIFKVSPSQLAQVIEYSWLSLFMLDLLFSFELDDSASSLFCLGAKFGNSESQAANKGTVSATTKSLEIFFIGKISFYLTQINYR